MKRVVANSLAIDLISQLERGFTGEIHSVFQHACNILTDRGELISLLSRPNSEGPGVIVVTGLDKITSDLRVGQKIIANRTSLMIENDYYIALSKASRWQSQTLVFPSSSKWPSLLQDVRKFEATQKNDQSNRRSLFYRQDEDNLYLRSTAELLKVRGEALISALKKGELRHAAELIPTLTGLGIGLTPSGDDFLAGLLLVLKIGTKEAGIPLSWFNRCFSNMAGKTNLISLKSLKASVDGQAWAVIEEFLATLFTGRREESDSALEKVLAIGSTSGSDCLVGLLAGIKVVINLGGQ